MFTAINSKCLSLKQVQSVVLRRAVICALAATVIASAGTVRARVVIQDGFTKGSANAVLAGSTPDTTNLPRGVYSDTGSQYQSTYNGTVPTNMAHLNINAGAYLPLATTSYAVTTPLTLSASVEVDTIQGGLVTGNTNGYPRGIGLGFSAVNTPGGDASTRYFDGVGIDQYGDVALVSNGVVGNVDTWNGSNGAFNPTNFYTLSYTYNPFTGGIAGVQVGGSNYVFASPTVAAASNYVAFYGSSASFNDGYLTNVLVSDTTSVPEPTSLTLIGVCGPLLLGRVRRKSSGRLLRPARRL